MYLKKKFGQFQISAGFVERDMYGICYLYAWSATIFC